jgi:hypothetical protein
MKNLEDEISEDEISEDELPADFSLRSMKKEIIEILHDYVSDRSEELRAQARRDGRKSGLDVCVPYLRAQGLPREAIGALLFMTEAEYAEYFDEQ